MSHKKQFIQKAVIAFLPWLDGDFDKALRYAERAWQRLCEKGYGHAKPTGPRPLADHYRALNNNQRVWFDRFWAAYNNKNGKQRAARRWGQLGQLSDNQYQRIIDAAKADADKPRPQDFVRKMAEGWLAERRWEDHQAKTAPSKADQRQQQQQKLAAELAHARKMAELGDDWWASEVQRIEANINAMRAGND